MVPQWRSMPPFCSGEWVLVVWCLIPRASSQSDSTVLTYSDPLSVLTISTSRPVALCSRSASWTTRLTKAVAWPLWRTKSILT